MILSEKSLLLKQAYLRNMFQKASKRVCTSNILVSSDHLLPAPPTFAAVKTLMTQNQQMK